MTVTRDQIIEAVRRAVEPLPYVNALWLGGSDAFGRADEYSDIDLMLDVAEGHSADGFAAVEAALESLSPIHTRWILPPPAPSGHPQRFYRLRDASVHHFVDLVVMEHGKPPFYNERELHGEPGIIFDKLGEVHAVANNKQALRAALERRLAHLTARAQIFEGLVARSLARGNALAALAEHQAYLRGLLAVVRMRLTPHRHEFGLEYARGDLPADVHQRLKRLWFVADADELAHKHAEAQQWFAAEVESLDLGELEL